MTDLLIGDQFDELFHSVRRSAFRLETRDRYDAPTEPVRRFLEGDPDEEYLRSNHAWGAMTRTAAAEGRQFQRVRVVSVPLGDYSRYALWSVQGNLAAGEDIRYLDRDQAAALGLPVRPPRDAWILDSERVAILHFDREDRLLGAEVLDDAATVEEYLHWRDVAWTHAQTREAFLKSL